MARTAISVTNITLAGVNPPASDGAAGDVANGNVVEYNNGKTTFVVVTNTSLDTEYDVTFVTPGTVGQEQHAIADKVEALAAQAQTFFGPFPQSVYGDSIQIDVENAALKLMAFSI